MKFFWKYMFPVFFGLVVYTSIRLVNDSMSKEQFWDRSWQQNVIEICFCMILGYVADRLLRSAINSFNRRKKQLNLQNVLREFGMISVVCMAIFNPALFLIHYLIHDPVDWNDFIIGNMLVILYTLLYYAIVRGNVLIRSFIEQQTQIEKIKNDQLQTELKFLKAQYHPHFLFNALNTIYFQMDENVPAAKQTIEKFSELLRYQLYDQHTMVPVQQELKYLYNFIHIQKTRASDKLQLTMEIDEGLNGEKVYPLLFLPLVENAFKYVGGEYHLSIAAKREEGYILFQVQNSIPSSVTKNGGGIGLENLQRRLQLLYPDKYIFTTTRTSDQFTAKLKLPV